MALRWRYYCLMRPFAPGAVPAGREVIAWEDLDPNDLVPEINHSAWSWVEYGRELTEKEISDYELAPARMRNNLMMEHAIIERAEKMKIVCEDRITHMLDIDFANRQFHLRFVDWLNADDFDFAHDWYGIMQNIDRATGKMNNHFVPRYAGQTA